MGFELERDRSIEQNVRLIAREQLEAAIALLERPDDAGVGTSIHEARKRAKMVRGLIRLVRPGLGVEYRTTNRLVRDGARQLSELRDAQALLRTFERLTVVEPALSRLDPIHDTLAHRAADASAAVAERDERLVTAIDLFGRALGRVDRWELPDGPRNPCRGALGTRRRPSR
jgi:CHAD domain-containing protein